MFTLRHIEKYNPHTQGIHESIRQAGMCWIDQDPDGKDHLYWSRTDDHGTHPTHEAEGGYATGVVYVMNESGKTVATYHFD